MKTGLKMIQKANVQQTPSKLFFSQLGESLASYVKYKEIMSGSRLLHNLRD